MAISPVQVISHELTATNAVDCLLTWLPRLVQIHLALCVVRTAQKSDLMQVYMCVTNRR
jgi:hypothetical protein